MSTCVKENYVLAMQTQKYILPINNLVTTCAFTLCGVYKGVTINVTNKLCNLIHLWYQLIRGERILSINHLPSSNYDYWLSGTICLITIFYFDLSAISVNELFRLPVHCIYWTSLQSSLAATASCTANIPSILLKWWSNAALLAKSRENTHTQFCKT